MRALIVNPLVLAVSAALGLALCRAMGWDPHVRAMVMAGAGCLVASEVGILPLLIHRGLMHPAQAGLLATVVHLMLATMLAGAIILTAHPPMAFVYWLLAFYWTTLISVATA